MFNHITNHSQQRDSPSILKQKCLTISNHSQPLLLPAEAQIHAQVVVHKVIEFLAPCAGENATQRVAKLVKRWIFFPGGTPEPTWGTQ